MFLHVVFQDGQALASISMGSEFLGVIISALGAPIKGTGKWQFTNSSAHIQCNLSAEIAVLAFMSTGAGCHVRNIGGYIGKPARLIAC